MMTVVPMLLLAVSICPNKVVMDAIVRSVSAGVYCGIAARRAMNDRKLFARLMKLMWEVEIVSGVSGSGGTTDGVAA